MILLEEDVGLGFELSVALVRQVFYSLSQLLYLLALGFFFFNYCCARWGYIGVFTKVLTMYEIYHS
jgi:hypothetical protein